MSDPDPFDRTPTVLVLLAEDEVAVRGLVRVVLEGAGYQVLVAEDGEEAWEVADRLDEPIDLLVTDVVMPRMQGDELAERVRRRQPELPVLFMSGYTENERLRSGELGAHQMFMEKPFTPAELLERARTLLTGTGRG